MVTFFFKGNLTICQYTSFIFGALETGMGYAFLQIRKKKDIYCLVLGLPKYIRFSCVFFSVTHAQAYSGYSVCEGFLFDSIKISFCHKATVSLETIFQSNIREPFLIADTFQPLFETLFEAIISSHTLSKPHTAKSEFLFQYRLG